VAATGLAAETSTRTAHEGGRPLNNANGSAEPKRMLRGLTPWGGGGVVVVVAFVVAVVLLTGGGTPPDVAGTPTASATATAAASVAAQVETIQDVGDRPSAIVRIGRDLFVTGR